MQENKKSIKLQKIGMIGLLCLLVVAFIGSMFCALILPFANVSGVASAESIIPPSLPHLSDLDSSTSVYGLKVDTSNLVYVVQHTFASSVNEYIGIEFQSLDGTPSYLYLNIVNGASGNFTLYFDYQDSSLPSSVFAGGDEGSPYGLGYILFDSPFTYVVPTDSKALSLTQSVYAITTPLSIGWSPEAFATRFVTPTGSPSNTVFFNLDVMPKSPNLELFKSYSSGSSSWYYYDYFLEYGTADSLIMANDVSTVGWHIDVHKKVLPPNTTILGYYVYLRIGMTDIYSYYVSGSDFDTGVISEQKWLFSSNYTFGDMKLYKYDFSGARSYYSLLPHEEGKVLPVDSQFGEGGWNSWLALFDLSNFVSLSSDSYINIGYQNAKLYYDELIRTKTQESFLQGKNQGYELGFQEGKAQGGNYTFTSLIGAVFDAPIEAFRGLFNFEILGTNMQGFVLALLTLSIIIVVIRYALGGK